MTFVTHLENMIQIIQNNLEPKVYKRKERREEKLSSNNKLGKLINHIEKL